MMSTRLSDFCDKIIEAGWLVTLTAVPLFFNPYLEIPGYVFEASKTFILRSVIFVMLAGWLIKKIEIGGLRFNLNPFQSFRKFPIMRPVLLLGIVFLISSIFSISPRLSFGGLYLREESFFSFISYILFFFLMVDGLKTKEQLNRILNTIILVSFPISLYGVFQHYGWDPTKYSGASVQTRVTSTFGGPIFVAGYLMMVLPLTFYFCIKSFTGKTVLSYLSGAAYTLILASQLACFIFAWSRGPLLGLLTASIFFILLLALVEKKRWLFATASGIIILAGIFFGLLNITNSPFPGLKKSAGRFGNIIQESQTGSGKVRLLTWDSALSIISSSPARLPFGPGLESLFYLYYRYTQPSFARFENSTAIPDHSHNETLDLLITGGILGLLAFLAIIILAAHQTLQKLGLINNRKETKIFGLILLFCLLAGILIPAAIKNSFMLIGLTTPLSLIGGIFFYFLYYLFFMTGTGAIDTEPDRLLVPQSGDSLLLIALFSGIIGHFVEIQFLFGLTATRLHFWTYLALITASGVILLKQTTGSATLTTSPDEKTANQKTNGSSRFNELTTGTGKNLEKEDVTNPALSGRKGVGKTIDYTKTFFLYSVLTGLILSILLFEQAKGKHPVTIITDLNYLVVIILWLFSGILIIISIGRDSCGERSRTNGKPFIWHFNFYLLYLLLSGLWAGIALMVHAWLITDKINLTDPPLFINLFYLWLGINLIMLISCLSGPAKNISASSNRLLKIPCYLFLLFLVWPVIYHLNFKKIYADAYCHLGDEYQSVGQWDKSINEFKRAIELAPRTDVYYNYISKSYEKKKDWPAAEKYLKQARGANPFTPEPLMNLAWLYQRWAESVPAERVQKLELALKTYEEIVQLAPLRPHIFKDWGAIYLLKKDYESAAEKYRRALALDESAELYFSLGYTYYLLNKIDETIESYEKAGRWNIPRAYDLLAKLAQEYFEKGNYEASVKTNLILIKFRPDNYFSYNNTALAYEYLNQLETSLQYAQKALELAPPERKQAAEDLKKNIENKLKPK